MTTNNSDRRSPGFWTNFFNSFRIAWKLFWDGRVPLSTKLIPFFVVGAYILFPFDIPPDFIPVLGQVDDVAVFLIGMQVFIALSPKDIVARIRAEVEGRPPGDGWTVTGSQPQDSDQPPSSSASDEIIDG